MFVCIVVASLLTLNPREVRKALTTATVVAHGETIVKPMTIDQVMDARDATAKVPILLNVYLGVCTPA